MQTQTSRINHETQNEREYGLPFLRAQTNKSNLTSSPSKLSTSLNPSQFERPYMHLQSIQHSPLKNCFFCYFSFSFSFVFLLRLHRYALPFSLVTHSRKVILNHWMQVEMGRLSFRRASKKLSEHCKTIAAAEEPMSRSPSIPLYVYRAHVPSREVRSVRLT